LRLTGFTVILMRHLLCVLSVADYIFIVHMTRPVPNPSSLSSCPNHIRYYPMLFFSFYSFDFFVPPSCFFYFCFLHCVIMLVIYPNTILFLGAFTKLWKATISFYVSVSNSVAATGETPIKFDI